MGVTMDQCRKLAAELVEETGARIVLECNDWPGSIDTDAIDGLLDIGLIIVRVGDKQARYVEWGETLYPERMLYFPDGYQEYREKGGPRWVVMTPGREIWNAKDDVELASLRVKAWELHDTEGR